MAQLDHETSEIIQGNWDNLPIDARNTWDILPVKASKTFEEFLSALELSNVN